MALSLTYLHIKSDILWFSSTNRELAKQVLAVSNINDFLLMTNYKLVVDNHMYRPYMILYINLFLHFYVIF